MKAKAYILDMDGVITSSSRQHFLAWKQMAMDEFGKDISGEVEDWVRGISRMDSLGIVLKDIGMESQVSEGRKKELATIKNLIYKNLISQFNESNLYDGTVDVLKSLKDAGVLIALGSASKNGMMLLEKMGIREYFDYVVNPHDIQEGKGKPEPDIFLKGAEGVKIDPKYCVGVEDAYAGITAVKAAGMLAVGIGSIGDLPHADIVYAEIGKMNFDEIEKLL